jgi:hypothetical protein
MKRIIAADLFSFISDPDYYKFLFISIYLWYNLDQNLKRKKENSVLAHMPDYKFLIIYVFIDCPACMLKHRVPVILFFRNFTTINTLSINYGGVSSKNDDRSGRKDSHHIPTINFYFIIMWECMMWIWTQSVLTASTAYFTYNIYIFSH